MHDLILYVVGFLIYFLFYGFFWVGLLFWLFAIGLGLLILCLLGVFIYRLVRVRKSGRSAAGTLTNQ